MLNSFTAPLLRFDEQGEKTGWTFIVIPRAVSEAMKPGQRTSFRVKGSFDTYPIRQVAVIPMGQNDEWDGTFIIPINAPLRKVLRKEAGTTIQVMLEIDNSPLVNSEDLMACLADVPEALTFFETLTPGHQRYYSRWIDEAKTVETKSKRISQAIQGFQMGMGYPEMIRHFKGKK
jgi:hypothetical protein